jgi:hypothetical protein
VLTSGAIMRGGRSSHFSLQLDIARIIMIMAGFPASWTTGPAGTVPGHSSTRAG